VSDRQTAINTILEKPGAVLVYFPEVKEPMWDEMEELYITSEPHEWSYEFWKESQSFDKATKENIYNCIHCNKSVLIFEDTCPNCNSTPYPED
jgi:hypothetical protein